MRFIVGFLWVWIAVLGGYAMHGGKIGVLWVPHEYIIILGAAIGAMIISNPGKTLKGVGKSFGKHIKGAPYKKDQFKELLCMMFHVFKVARTKGMLELESHIENPHESAIFSKYPKFQHDHHAIVFFTDYLRLLTMGIENHYQIEDLMNAEMETHHHENEEVAMAVTNMGDGMPALGIVAAVLGVINTMGSITEPPEILGKMIGSALVGTFFGVFASYGFFAPMGQFLGKYFAAEHKYYECMKVGLLTHMQGNAPQITIEFARKVIPPTLMPTFQEMEEAVQQIQMD